MKAKRRAKTPPAKRPKVKKTSRAVAKPKRAAPKKRAPSKPVRRAPAKPPKRAPPKPKKRAPPKAKPSAKVRAAARLATASKVAREDVSRYVYRFQERLNDGSSPLAINRAYHKWYASKERARKAIGQDAFRRVLLRIWNAYDFDLDEVDAYAES